MLEEIKLELKNGKKIYIFEALSIVAFIFFLVLGAKIPVLTTTPIGNIIMLVWMLINALVLVIYEMNDFAKFLLNEKKVSKNFIRSLLIKVVLFISIFMINVFPITAVMMLSGMQLGIDMSLPLLSLMVGLFIVSLARKNIPSAKILTVLGCLWFITMFSILYLVYPLIYIGVLSFAKQAMIAATVSSMVIFSIALLVFYQLIKRIKKFLADK